MHIDKSTPKAHKNNTLRVYAFGHNLLHSTFDKSIPTHTFKVRHKLAIALSKHRAAGMLKGHGGKPSKRIMYTSTQIFYTKSLELKRPTSHMP